MATKIPLRVLRCTTHHHACDCREYQYERMETALKIIQTWASIHNKDVPHPLVEQIINKCQEALGRLDA